MFLLNISTSINNQSSCFQADGFQAPTCSPLPRGLRVPPMFCFWLIILFPIFIYITQQKSPKAILCQDPSKHSVSLWEHSPTLEYHLIIILEQSVWKHFHQYDLSKIYSDLRSFPDNGCVHDRSIIFLLSVLNDHGKWTHLHAVLIRKTFKKQKI